MWLTCLLAASAFAQTATLGSFTNSDDVGDPPIKGAAEFDRATSQYKITGSGSDIWAKADQFHYVWREMSGDFAVTATTKFLTEGIGHRKAVIMLRKTLDTDSPFVQLAIHGDGTPAVQFRNAKADNTNTVDFPTEGPGTWSLKLVRKGTTVTVWIAKDGTPLRELGHTVNQLGSPILVGLGVSSHSQAATNTVLFSDVSVEQLPGPTVTRQEHGIPDSEQDLVIAMRQLLFISLVSASVFAQNGSLGLFSHSGDVGNPDIKGSVQFSDGQY